MFARLNTSTVFDAKVNEVDDPLLLGLVAGYGIAIPVGAIAVLIVQTGIRCGFRCAAAAGAGAATADLTYATLAVTGGASLSVLVRSVQQPIRWTSAAILAAIAIVGLLRVRQAPAIEGPVPARRREHARTYARFLGLTIVNPMTVVYFVAIVLGSGFTADLTASQGLVFVAGAFIASLSWQMLLAGVGGLARHALPRHLHTGASIAGHLLILVMAVLIVTP